MSTVSLGTSFLGEDFLSLKHKITTLVDPVDEYCVLGDFLSGRGLLESEKKSSFIVIRFIYFRSALHANVGLITLQSSLAKCQHDFKQLQDEYRFNCSMSRSNT